jgi:hypothetical protein
MHLSGLGACLSHHIARPQTGARPGSTADRKGAKKPIDEIGSTKITAGPEGMTAEIIHTELPSQKEPLEKFFGEAFQAQFNSTKPLAVC